MGGAAAAAKNCDLCERGWRGTRLASRVQRSGRYQPRECFSYQYHGHEYATALAHLEPGAALALDLERRANSTARRRDATHTRNSNCRSRDARARTTRCASLISSYLVHRSSALMFRAPPPGGGRGRALRAQADRVSITAAAAASKLVACVVTIGGLFGGGGGGGGGGGCSGADGGAGCDEGMGGTGAAIERGSPQSATAGVICQP